MERNKLSAQINWDQHWNKINLPVKVTEANSTPYVREILKVFKTFLPKEKGLTVLEIGGAPGGYLAYLARTFGYKAYALDKSDVGCKRLEENFQILGIPLTVYRRDILEDVSDIPKVDIVYSLGLIEHFSDPLPIISKHIQLLKVNGILLLGVPTILGINKVVMRILSPDNLTYHNLKVMDLKEWAIFEKEFRLKMVFKGYIGGWEPRMYLNPGMSLPRRVVNKFIIILADKLLDRLYFLRTINSKLWSGYAVGVYQKLPYV